MPDEVAEVLSDNAALNEIVRELTLIEDHLTGEYDSITGDDDFEAVSDSVSHERDADALAIKTVVSNFGPDPALVLEDGIQSMIVPAGEARALALGGKGAIEVKCGTGDNSQVAIATYRKTT